MKGTLRIIPAIAAAIFLTALFPIAASASSSGGALSGALSGGAYPSVTMGEAISAPAQAGGAAAISAGTAWTGTPATSATVAPGGTAAGIAGALPTASGAGIDAGGLATGEAGAGATDAPGAGTDEAGMPGAEGAAAGTEGAPAAAADGGTAAAPEADAATQAAQFSPLAAMEANTVDQLKGMMEAAAEGDVITLGAGFAADLAAKGPVSAAISHSNSFTIDGKAAGTLEAASGKRHFIIERAGGGKTVFSGLDIKGAASGAGGIEMTGGAYVFSSCAFVDISAMAALAVSGSAQVEIDSSSFSGNRTAVDMGADAAAGKSLAAKGSSFEDSAMSAIIAGSAALSLDGCVFARGGDTAVQGGVSVEISQCSFVNNVGQAKAGALAASPAGSYRISRSSFVGNSNAGGPGGAVSLSQGTEFVIDRSSFAGNYVTADAAGGAIYGASLDGATLRVSGCVFTGNEARYTGASAANSDGGAIAIIGASGAGAAVEIYGCSFKDNRAGDDGGAVMLEGPALRARIVNSTFSGNSCAGALDTAAGGHDGSGGAVKLLSMQQSEIVHCTFYANEAALGIGGNLGGGGAVACQAGPGGAGAPLLVNNIFIANISTPAGRGNVYLAPGCDAGAANTGNVGLDNGMPGFSNGESPADGIIAAELFADIEAGRALPHYYGEPVGSSGNTVQRFCYIVGPRIDEMYALGQRPAYREDIPDDALGMRRDREPSAGAAENHWIKYDPGSAKGGFWASAPSGAVKALRSDAYYFSWKEGEPGLTALLGSFLGAPMPGAAFMGWQSDQPEDPAAAEPQYPTVLPGDDVKASKQTYTAIWRIGYKVEFDLRYGGLMLAPLTDVPAGSTISAPSAPARPGYTFTGWRKGAGADAAGWSFDIDTVNADTVLYASWVWNPGVGSGDASNPGARPGGSTGSSTGPSGGAPVGTGTADQGQGATQPDTAGQADPQAPDPQTPAPTDPQTPAPVGPQAPAVPDAVPETPPVVEYPVSDQVYTGNAGTTASNAGSNSNNSSGNNAGTAATGAGSGASVIGAGNADSAGGDESDGEEGIYGGAFGFQTEPPVEQPGLGGLGGSDITETPFTPPTSTESDAGSLIPEFTSTTEDYTLPQTLRLVFNNLPALLHSRYGDDIPIISVFEARVPLVGRNGEIALSFLNCLLMILALLLPVLVFFGNLRKRREQTELGYGIEKGFKPLCIILAIGAGLLSVLTFFITQDIYARVILIDRWTVLMGIILLISAVMSVLARYQSTEDRIGISSTKIM